MDREQLKAALRRAAEAEDFAAADEIAAAIEQLDASAPNSPDAKSARAAEIKAAKDRGEVYQQPSTGRKSTLRTGVERITAGDVSPQEAFEAFVETPVRAAAAPVGGDYVAAGAENIVRTLTGQDVNPQALAEQRGRRQELREENALGSLAGEALGMGGAGMALAARGVPGVIANSALVGGASGALQSEDPLTGGLTGAAAGAAGGAVLKGLGQVAKTVANYLSSTAGTAARRLTEQSAAPAAQTVARAGQRAEMASGMAAVRKRLVDADGRRVTPAQLSQLRDEWVATHGSEPRPLDLITAAAARRFGSLAAGKRGAQQEFAAAQAPRAQARATEVPAAIMDGQGRVSPDQIRRLRTEDYTADLDRLGQQTVPITSEIRALINNQDVARALGRGPTGRRLSEIAAELRDGNTGRLLRPLTLRDLEDIRTGLSAAANREGALPSDMRELVQLGEMAEAAAASLDPQYSQALNLFRRRSQFAEGVQSAPDVTRGASTALQQGVGDMTPSQLRGTQAGVRTSLADASTKARGARRVAEDLQEPGVQENLEALYGPQEAARLRDLGAQEVRSIENYRAVDVAPQDGFPSDVDTRTLLGAGAVAASPRGGSPVTKSNIASRIFDMVRGLGIPPGAARGAARIMTDGSPQSVQRVIDELVRAGVAQDALDAVLRQANAWRASAMEGAAE